MEKKVRNLQILFTSSPVSNIHLNFMLHIESAFSFISYLSRHRSHEWKVRAQSKLCYQSLSGNDGSTLLQEEGEIKTQTHFRCTNMTSTRSNRTWEKLQVNTRNQVTFFSSPSIVSCRGWRYARVQPRVLVAPSLRLQWMTVWGSVCGREPAHAATDEANLLMEGEDA